MNDAPKGNIGGLPKGVREQLDHRWFHHRGRRHAGRQCRCRGGERLVRLGETRVRPGPTRSDQKNMNMTRNGKIGRLPKAVRRVSFSPEPQAPSLRETYPTIDPVYPSKSE